MTKLIIFVPISVIFNSVDNCPFDWNPSQDDSDRDGVGDLCDNCPDFKSSVQVNLTSLKEYLVCSYFLKSPAKISDW